MLDISYPSIVYDLSCKNKLIKGGKNSHHPLTSVETRLTARPLLTRYMQRW